MPTYIIRAIETTLNEVEYTIDANSLEKAQEKALLGESDSEVFIATLGVISRDISEVQ